MSYESLWWRFCRQQPFDLWKLSANNWKKFYAHLLFFFSSKSLQECLIQTFIQPKHEVFLHSLQTFLFWTESNIINFEIMESLFIDCDNLCLTKEIREYLWSYFNNQDVLSRLMMSIHPLVHLCTNNCRFSSSQYYAWIFRKCKYQWEWNDRY